MTYIFWKECLTLLINVFIWSSVLYLILYMLVTLYLSVVNLFSVFEESEEEDE